MFHYNADNNELIWVQFFKVGFPAQEVDNEKMHFQGQDKGIPAGLKI